MAHTAVVRWFWDIDEVGQRTLVVEATEEEAQATSQWCMRNNQLDGVTVFGPDGSAADVPLPRTGKVVHFHCAKVSGSATTLAPRNGHTTNWAAGSIDDIGGQPAPAAFVNDGTELAFTMPLGKAPNWFAKSVPDTGTDNVITTRLAIVRHR